MYPQEEIIRLAACKDTLRRRIALRRVECAEAAARVTQPLEWFDRALAFWRRLTAFAPFAAVPLGFVIQRAIFPRRKMLGSVLRWAPLVVGAMRGIGSAFRARSHGLDG